METWEKELREKLEKELPEGYRLISEGDLHIGTGKGGAIEIEVAFQKAIRDMTFEVPTQIKNDEKGNLTLEEFRKSIYEWMTKKK